MKNNQTRNLVFTALCIAIGLLLPQIVNVIPISYPGSILLPMHIPVLICGFVCGARYGALSGAILPLLAFALTGMPPIFPTGVSMMVELATYGMLTGLLYKYSNGKIFLSLIGAMIGGRIVYGLVNTILFSIADQPFGIAIFISGAFVTALPGIIIQLIFIPSIIYALKRTNIVGTH